MSDAREALLCVALTGSTETESAGAEERRPSAVKASRCDRCGSRVLPCSKCSFAAAIEEIDAPDLTDMRIGPYRLGRLLGQGGVGLVYEAVDTRVTSPRYGRKVALKILSADVASPAPLVREAQFGALEHEHILPVYDVGEDEGVAYLAMMYVDGGPLTTPAATPRRAAEIALKIARAVKFAHQNRTAHRDLKPANVLVDREGRVFVTDFGLAERDDLVDGSTMAGTPEYMAPEVWRGEGGAASNLTDLWSIGVILYQLLAGHPPFTGASLAELEHKIAALSPAPLVRVPADLAAICARCLQKDPALRYATANEIGEDLERFLAHEPVRARPLGPIARLCRSARRHPLIAALALLLVFAAGLAFEKHLSQERAQFLALQAELSRDRAERALLQSQHAALKAAEVTARYAADHFAVAFQRYSALLEHVGRDPRIASALGHPRNAQQITDGVLRQYPAFSTVDLFDAAGTLVGRSPAAPHDNRGRSYKFRDYFRGAEEHAKQGLHKAYISRAYRSEADDKHEIAISLPIYDDAGRWVGVLTTALHTGAALGEIELGPLSDGLTVALISPRDRERDRPRDEPDPEPSVILHAALPAGEVRPAADGDFLGADGFMHVVQIPNTPLSVVVRFAFNGPVAK